MSEIAKALKGQPYIGEIPEYIKIREQGLSFQIERQTTRRYGYPNVLVSLYVGTIDELRASGLIYGFDDIRLPKGHRKPSSFILNHGSPLVLKRGLFRYGDERYCAKVEEVMPTTSAHVDGVVKYEFISNDELETTAYLGTSDTLAKLTERFENPFEAGGHGYSLSNNGVCGYRSMQLPGNAWLWVVRSAIIKRWTEENAEENAPPKKDSTTVTVDDYRESLLLPISFATNRILEAQEKTLRDVRYRLPDDVLEEVKDGLRWAFHAIKTAEISVRRLDCRSDEEKQTARERVAAAQTDGAFQAFLKSCMPVSGQQL